MTWPLPDNAFIPGRTTRSTHPAVLAAATAASDITEPSAWRENRTYLYGIDLHNHGFHWEAHEVWEPVWMGCAPNSRERALLQGLIQLTNACLKLRMSRRGASARLLEIAQRHFDEAGRPAVMGLAPAQLKNQAQKCLQDGQLPRVTLDRDHP